MVTICGGSYVVNLFKQKVVSQKKDLFATVTLHNDLFHHRLSEHLHSSIHICIEKRYVYTSVSQTFMSRVLLQKTLWRILDSQYIVTHGLCNITAKQPSEGRCSWRLENHSVAPKGGRGPRLRNPGLNSLADQKIRRLEKMFNEITRKSNLNRTTWLKFCDGCFTIFSLHPTVPWSSRQQRFV